MDLEEVKKINNLSRELQKHKFSSSSEDAYEQAEGVFQGQRQKKPETQQAEVIQMQTNNLPERQFQIQMDDLTKQISQELDSFRTAVNQLIQEMNTIKADVDKIKDKIPKEKQTTVPKQEAHPRQGDYKSKDVDIKKMFYCGNK